MVDLAGVSEGMSVYDPVCGTGGLLLEAALRIKRKEGDLPSLLLYGQELDPAKVEIASRELTAQSLRAAIVAGDTLRAPRQLFDRAFLPTFDVVLAHPPFSLADWGREGWLWGDPLRRARLGRPPDGNGDYAFILHALASLKPYGRAVLLLPMGVLYRGGAEAEIRTALICEGVIDAVVSLPPGVNRGTKAPTMLLVLQRDRPLERRDKVLLVDGAAKATGAPAGQSSMPLDLSGLAELAQWEAKEDVYRRVVSIKEIAEQEFNLSLERFAPPGGASTSPPAPMRPRRVKGPPGKALPANLEAYEQAVQKAVQRAGEIFSCAIGGQPIHIAVAGEIPAHWSLEPLGKLLAQPLRNGTSFPKAKGAQAQSNEQGQELLQVGQTAFTEHGVLDVRSARSLAPQALIKHEDKHAAAMC
ncbi:MAG: N-6 DNA methylase [Deltaproteobacteria bacterium]|nr:N-6 DNA methylase [Deltaproteobacteria bacterium]